jgi:branched-chain amino acid aminotransferase
MIYFFRDKYVEDSFATIDIMSPSVQYGLNVFEGIRGYYNNENETLNIVELNSHIYRLLDSARFLNIKHSYDFSTIHSSIIKTIKLNNLQCDIYIRVVLLFDKAGSWITQDDAVLLIVPLKSNQFDLNKPFLSAKISSWERINGRSLPPRIKAGANYLNSRLAQQEIKLSGFDMAIFLNSFGYVSEAPGSCIFMIKNENIFTPSLNSSILASITRSVIINIIEQKLNKKVIEDNLERIDFYQANEVFLCGTAIEITPIKSLDHIEYVQNNITKRIMEIYKEFILGEIEISNSEIFKMKLI